MSQPTTHPREPSGGHRALGHVVPVAVLLVVFGALIVLTAATVAATWIDLGGWNLGIALGIATVKAALVALYFMHLRYDHPFHALIWPGLSYLVPVAYLARHLAIPAHARGSAAQYPEMTQEDGCVACAGC